MSTSDEMDRKTFLKASLAWAAVTLSGCGGGSSSGGTGGSGAGTGGMSGGTGGAGGMSGGTGGAGGETPVACTDDNTPSMFTVTSETNNGNHSHPLHIPGIDVERMTGTPGGCFYVLEDGGTGHTHTVTLTYELLYLKFNVGTETMTESTMTNGHTHNCVLKSATTA
jgi:hypothetical protein